MTRTERRAQVQHVWDVGELKFCVLVKAVINAQRKVYVGASGKRQSLYVRILCGKYASKTTCKYPAKWNELRLFHQLAPTAVIKFELMRKSLGFDKLLGSCVLGSLQELSPEDVQEHQLLLKSSKSSRSDNEQVSLFLVVRCLFSVLKETRAETPMYKCNFFDKQYLPKLKTGDLIVYDCPGVSSTVIKLASLSNSSHLGLVVFLPNKWTEKEQPYVLELTRNVDGFVDAFRETASSGISLFHLRERLYQINCSRAWWVPLSKPLSAFEDSRLKDYIWDMHSLSDIFSVPPLCFTRDDYLVNFVRSLIAGDARKSRMLFLDFDQGAFFGGALQAIGLGEPKRLPNDIVQCQCFGKPVLIRQLDRIVRLPADTELANMLTPQTIQRRYGTGRKFRPGERQPPTLDAFKLSLPPTECVSQNAQSNQSAPIAPKRTLPDLGLPPKGSSNNGQTSISERSPCIPARTTDLNEHWPSAVHRANDTTPEDLDRVATLSGNTAESPSDVLPVVPQRSVRLKACSPSAPRRTLGAAGADTESNTPQDHLQHSNSEEEPKGNEACEEANPAENTLAPQVRAVVLRDHEAAGAGEISVQRGEFVDVFEETSNGWLVVAREDGTQGMLPSNCCVLQVSD